MALKILMLKHLHSTTIVVFALTKVFSLNKMKVTKFIGFRYVNDSAKLGNCSKLADEICNGGPKVWKELFECFSKCPRPCKFTSYTLSNVDYSDNLFWNPKGCT